MKLKYGKIKNEKLYNYFIFFISFILVFSDKFLNCKIFGKQIIVQRNSCVNKAIGTMRSKSSRDEKEERRRDELRYLAQQPCARCKLRLSLGYSGTSKSPATPTFRRRVSQPLLHRRWHPWHSN